uniref:Uncharacterized protein n=2 Tax=Oryza TaxID=4527 RepID=A0A0E0P402_ORYRU
MPDAASLPTITPCTAGSVKRRAPPKQLGDHREQRLHAPGASRATPTAIAMEAGDGIGGGVSTASR